MKTGLLRKAPLGHSARKMFPAWLRSACRQLQWWDERQVISPDKQGHRRFYRTEQAVEIAIIAELKRKGLSLKKIRQTQRLYGEKWVSI